MQEEKREIIVPIIIPVPEPHLLRRVQRPCQTQTPLLAAAEGDATVPNESLVFRCEAHYLAVQCGIFEHLWRLEGWKKIQQFGEQ